MAVTIQTFELYPPPPEPIRATVSDKDFDFHKASDALQRPFMLVGITKESDGDWTLELTPAVGYGQIFVQAPIVPFPPPWVRRLGLRRLYYWWHGLRSKKNADNKQSREH